MRFLGFLLLGVASAWVQAGRLPSDSEDAAALLRSARAALEAGDAPKAAELAGQATRLEPRNAVAHYLQGVALDRQRKHAEALARLERALQLNPQMAEACNERGSVRFKLGQVEAAIRDFDRYIELRPRQEPGHWKRGIAYYYASRFADGKQQFEGYQTVDSNDVENAVWRFLCMAPRVGVAKARADLLKVGEDRRVPMRQVYELFAGRARPEDVLAAVRQDKPTADQLNERLFYAHLYLGLYFEAHGEAGRSADHLAMAEKHKIGHYMWDVARVHRELRKKAKGPG